MNADMFAELNQTVRLAIEGGWGTTARLSVVIVTLTVAGVLIVHAGQYGGGALAETNGPG